MAYFIITIIVGVVSFIGMVITILFKHDAYYGSDDDYNAWIKGLAIVCVTCFAWPFHLAWLLFIFVRWVFREVKDAWS